LTRESLDDKRRHGSRRAKKNAGIWGGKTDLETISGEANEVLVGEKEGLFLLGSPKHMARRRHQAKA